MSTARISSPTHSRPGMGTIRRRLCASLALAVSLAATPAASADSSPSRAASLSRVELEGSRITVSAHCNAPTKIQLQAGRQQLRKALANAAQARRAHDLRWRARR